jgi:hypothetical protein
MRRFRTASMKRVFSVAPGARDWGHDRAQGRRGAGASFRDEGRGAKIRELQRLLGKKTEENEILKEGLEYARKKK